jgi:prophage antirepressor-like protein
MTNNNIMMFPNVNFGTVRVVMIENEPWFVGKDIAEILGYVNTNDALIKYVDEDEKAVIAIHDGSQNRNMTVINESGLYSLVFGSKLPNAKSFKKWITSEVIPAIRKTGSFDIIEDNIKNIEDEIERNLKLEIYQYEKLLQINPDNQIATVSLKLLKIELDQYIQKKDVELLKNVSTYIADRTTFRNLLTNLARKYFNGKQDEASNTVINKLKAMSGFDAHTRVKNIHKKLNEDRKNEGKKEYAKATLRGRYNTFDAIEEDGRWVQAVEALKAVEIEQYSSRQNKLA